MHLGAPSRPKMDNSVSCNGVSLYEDLVKSEEYVSPVLSYPTSSVFKIFNIPSKKSGVLKLIKANKRRKHNELSLYIRFPF